MWGLRASLRKIWELEIEFKCHFSSFSYYPPSKVWVPFKILKIRPSEIECENDFSNLSQYFKSYVHFAEFWPLKFFLRIGYSYPLRLNLSHFSNILIIHWIHWLLRIKTLWDWMREQFQQFIIIIYWTPFWLLY